MPAAATAVNKSLRRIARIIQNLETNPTLPGIRILRFLSEFEKLPLRRQCPDESIEPERPQQVA